VNSTDKDTKPPLADEESAPAAAIEETDAIDAASDEPESVEIDPLEVLQNDNKDLQDKNLRLAAEMENLRRRTEREKKDMAKYGISNFAKDIIAVDDNLSRALSAVPEGAITKDPALKTLVEGVEMTGRELASALERNGISRIDPKGEVFDPNLHQAMFELPNPDVCAGTILEVVACGFMIDSRVLRPAMVGIAKGGEKPKKEAAKDAAPSDNEGTDKEEGVDKTA